MSTGTGINVSKAQIYGVLGKSVGLNVSKALAYAVIQVYGPGINVSKALMYGVLTSGTTTGNVPSSGGPMSSSGNVPFVS